MQKIQEKLQQFMIGRNGSDDLSRFVILIAFFTLVISFFFWKTFFNALTLALLVYSYFRIISKNTVARQRENQAYVAFKRPYVDRFRSWRNYRATRKQYKDTHAFFKCKNCHHHLRVPKGKGKVVVTCPNCHEKFEAHT